MDIIVCTTARTDDEARALLDGIQFPVPAVRRARASDAEPLGDLDGEEEFDREEQPAPPAGEAIRRPSARALKAIASDQTKPMEERFAARAQARANCRATRRRPASATAAR